MDKLQGKERADYIRTMFTRIAGRYDFMNRLMTFGQDIRWRKEVVRRAQLDSSSRLLDIGSGTGDLLREAQKQHPGIRAAGVDFTFEMMKVGRKEELLDFTAADALCLPLGNDVFDGVISAFLMRNVVDIQRSLEEQFRVLKPGGRVVVLDTTRPKKNILWPFIWFYLHVLIPAFGKLLSSFGEAYFYLPESTEGFVTAEELAERMSSAGFSRVGYRRLMFGTVAIHWGEK